MAISKSILDEEERKWLKENCNTKSYEQLQAKLGLGRKGIINELELMGMKKEKVSTQNRVCLKNCFEDYNTKEQDYINFLQKIIRIKQKCKTGYIGKCKVVKMYKDKVLLLNKNGHTICPTYAELALGLKR